MNNPQLPVPQGEMSFIDHLEELRWHILRSFIAIGVISVVAFMLPNLVFDVIIFGPKGDDFLTYQLFCELSNALQLGDTLCLTAAKFEIINVDMMGQFLAHIKIALIIGFITAFPYVFWEIWRFIEPALYDEERKYTKGVVFVSSFLFAVGALFGYFILSPFSINFFATYQVSETVNNTIVLSSYVAIISTLVLASGIMFELPLVVYFLSKVGLVTPDLMREYRKHAFVVILFVAAIITPADIWTQILVSIPVYGLYELSVFVSARVVRNLETAS